MKYTIRFSREAAADFDSLYQSDIKLSSRILNKIDSLESSPEEGNPLVGNHQGEYSLRVGNCRVVYELDQAKHIADILTIKPRKHVY